MNHSQSSWSLLSFGGSAENIMRPFPTHSKSSYYYILKYKNKLPSDNFIDGNFSRIESLDKLNSPGSLVLVMVGVGS